MKNTGRFLLAVLFLLVLVPQMALAAWWNPFSWFDNWAFVKRPRIEVQPSNEGVFNQDENKNISTTPTPTQDQDSQQDNNIPKPDSQQDNDTPRANHQPLLPVSESSVNEDAPVSVSTTNNPAVIKSIEAKASSDGVLYSDEKAYVHGTGLSGDLTIKLGNIEPKYVYTSGISDTYAEFVVPAYSQPVAVSVTITNSSGEVSNFYQVEVK